MARKVAEEFWSRNNLTSPFINDHSSKPFLPPRGELIEQIERKGAFPRNVSGGVEDGLLSRVISSPILSVFPSLLDISWPAIFRASPRKTWGNWITRATTIRETNGLSSCEKEKKGEERNYCFSMIDRIRYLASIIEELSVRRQRRSKVNWVTIAPLSSLEFHSRIWKRAEALKRSRNFLVPPWKLTFPPVIYDLIFISTLNFLFEIWFVFNVIRILFRCWWKLMINQFLIWLIFRNCCGRRK